MNALYFGVGRELITPAVGGQLYGYNPDIRSTRVEDDLTVTALYFRQGNEQALMLVATVCLIQTELARRILALLEAECGVPQGKLLLSATHTHSGPNTAGSYGWGALDTEYCEGIFIPAILKAAKKAMECPQQVTVAAAAGESLVGVNRRQRKEDGRIYLGQDPAGFFDPTMTVLSFLDKQGHPVANLIHYGCHGTAAGKNTEITRDWSGLMTDALEKETGAVTAFLNGPEGDVGPRISNGLTVGDLSYVYELGQKAAADVLRIYKGLKPCGEVRLSAETLEAPVPLKARMAREVAQKMLEDYKGKTVNVKGQTRVHLEEVLSAWEQGLREESHFVFPQTVLRLGGYLFVSFPFELFSEIGLKLNAAVEGAAVLSLSNTNGSESYFATEKELPRGGYETEMHLYTHPQTYANGADDALVQITLQNICRAEKE